MTRARGLALGVPLVFAAAAAIYLLVGLRARPSASFAWMVIAAALLGALVVALERSVSAVVRPRADEPARVGDGRRRELLREKALTLRALKELEFDFRMGKLGEADYAQMAAGLRARATRLLRELDEAPAPRAVAPAPRGCASCRTVNDADAVFCKRCGSRL